MTEPRPYASIPGRRALTLALRLSWAADRARTALRLVLAIVDAVAFALEPLGLKLLVDGALRRDGRGAGLAVALIVILHAIGLLANWFGFMIGMRLREAVAEEVDVRLIGLTSAAPGIEHLERPDYADELLLLRNERELFVTTVDSLSRNLAIAGSIATTVTLLATVHPFLALLPLCGLPALATNARATKVRHTGFDAMAAPFRVRNFTYGLGTKASAAKEIRVFGLAEELTRRYDRANDELRTLQRDSELRAMAWVTLGWIVFTAGFGAALAFVAERAVHGHASLGQLVLTLTLAGRVNGQVDSAVQVITWFLNSLRNGRRLVWLEDYAVERCRDLAPQDPLPVPTVLAEGITFDNVCFEYPGTARMVLRDVSLHLPAGSTAAIVGDNGVGKTTLVKLLTRMYEPTSGRILVDGADLRRLPIDWWRTRVAAGFQDFVRYELEACRTVGVGDLPFLDDAERVTRALEQASAADVIADLPGGLTTQLGKSFDGGVELSGGQWQKLALGRSLMREEPLVLVLDEPTSALDAATEHALFERFVTAADRVGSRTGAVTIIVSHRFSTVRRADLIIVLQNGSLVEVGSHVELLARGGVYDELYRLQSAGYR